jgi:HK97 family phage portal protein
VIVRGADGTKRELYGLFDSSTPIPRPSQWGSRLSYSNVRVGLDNATGLPAFLRAYRLISETAAGLPMTLYRGFGLSRRPMPDAPQLALLRRPNPDASPFTVWSYVFGSLLRGNGYLWKLRTSRRGPVKFLYPINPAFVTPKYEGDRATFEIRDREYGPVVREVGKDQIIHIPGILINHPYVGVSVIEAHRQGIGNELGRERFEGRYIANDATPGAVLKHPGNPSKEQRDELRAGFESRHNGEPGRPAVMWGGWELDHMPVSLQEAQFIESKRFGVQDIGRMLGVPGSLLGEPDYRTPESPEQENMKFLQHGLMPWMERLEHGLASDIDLFPEPDWCVELDTAGFVRADIQTRYNAYRLARQGGWKTPNEIRSDEGLAPVDGGDEIQQTPVGGAANDTPPATTGGGEDG